MSWRFGVNSKQTSRHVRFVVNMVNRAGISIADLSKRSGVGESTIKFWTRKSAPTLENYEAVLNALGYTLQPYELTGAVVNLKIEFVMDGRLYAERDYWTTIPKVGEFVWLQHRETNKHQLFKAISVTHSDATLMGKGKKFQRVVVEIIPWSVKSVDT